MYIRIITKEEKEQVSRMEEFAASHKNGHFLQLPRWAQVKEFWLWRGILAYEGETIVGTMSVLIRSLPLGLSFFYVPRGPVCDRNDTAVMLELFAAAKELAIQQKSLLLMMDPDEPDSNEAFRHIMEEAGFSERQDTGFGNIQAQHVFRLSLTSRTEEDIFNSFYSKTRYSIRLALRRGVQIRRFYGNEEIPEEELDNFAALNKETGERDHFIPRNKEYFRKVLKSFGADTVLFMAYWEQKPIAGTIGMFAAQKGWYLYGASSNDHRDTMPNYLLQWEMIRCAICRNCRFYDLRGVPGDLSEDNSLHGLYRFKKQFGGEYTKFTGLFIYRFRPFLARCFLLALRIFRHLRSLQLKC